MSAFRPGNMRGRRETTPVLLLLLLVTSLTGTVLCQSKEDLYGDEETEAQPSGLESTEGGDTVLSAAVSDTASIPDSSLQEESSPSSAPLESVSSTTSTSDTSLTQENSLTSAEGSIEEKPVPADASPDKRLSSTTSMPETEDLNPTIILIPVALVVLIIAIIVGGIVIQRRCIKNINNTDHTKEDSDFHSENVPMPKFEEDVPSVLELDMEELDQLMNKNG
ncbi:hypothetical protein LDENG_00055790 [Lucifuga dentata]|nr:hypothetical protein LDENG_00055790 [Lucifuga dentata]